MSDPVRLEVSGGIATITLDRPEVRNAVDRPTAEALSAALDTVDCDPAIRVAVLTGAGRTFCAGMDLKAFSATGERPIAEARGGFGIVRRPPDKPILAAVEGNALGGGLEIALACDLIVVGKSTSLGLPEVKRGLVAAAGGVIRLPRQIPPALARELILTGRPMSAERALAVGLVNAIAPDGNVLAAAQALAAEIAENAPLAVRASKRIARESELWDLEGAFDLQEAFVAPVRGSHDAAEGARAFLEKRRPEWSGS